ncbi:oxidoreductase [Pandoraea capi]|uniref:Oxidoreductase n=1 Tax=Pandoraea capi TaxID=2508286 RepID=A0ABY6W8Q4_9BURK|nr:hypothetical protein [Pandoraea capi]VVE35999.1 oxidoreductase [Pandoraea capi]
MTTNRINKRLKVYAKDGWQDTGYKVGAQDAPKVILRAEGEWCTRTDDRKFGRRDANGRTPNSGATYLHKVSGDKAYPYHGGDALMGQLVGRFGESGEPFLVGNHKSFRVEGMPKDVSLWLCCNDPLHSAKQDNDGALDVTLELDDARDVFAPRPQHFDRPSGTWVDD